MNKTPLMGIGNPIVVASFPRSGTHLMIDLLRRHFPCSSSWKLPLESKECLYLNIDRLGDTHSQGLSSTAAASVCRRVRRPLVKTHSFAGIGFLESLSPDFFSWVVSSAHFIYVVRNPFEVLSSLYALASHAHQEVRAESFQAFLRNEGQYFIPGQQVYGDPTRVWCQHVRSWTDNSSALPILYEDLVKNTEQSLRLISAHIRESSVVKEPLLPKRRFGKWDARIDRVLGGKPQSTAIQPLEFRYKCVRWVDLANEGDEQYVIQVIQEEWPSMEADLRKLSVQSRMKIQR